MYSLMVSTVTRKKWASGIELIEFASVGGRSMSDGIDLRADYMFEVVASPFYREKREEKRAGVGGGGLGSGKGSLQLRACPAAAT